MDASRDSAAVSIIPRLSDGTSSLTVDNDDATFATKVNSAKDKSEKRISKLDGIVDAASSKLEEFARTQLEIKVDDITGDRVNSPFSVDPSYVARKRIIPSKYHDVLNEMIVTISGVLGSLIELSTQEIEKSLLLMAMGESSLRWPPAIVLSTDDDSEIKRFGTFQVNVPISKELEALYGFKFNPIDADSHIYLQTAYFFDIFMNTREAFGGDWSPEFMASKFSQFVPYVDFNINSGYNQLFSVVAYHRAGLCPELYSEFPFRVEDDIIARLPIRMMKDPLRSDVVNDIQRRQSNENAGG